MVLGKVAMIDIVLEYEKMGVQTVVWTEGITLHRVKSGATKQHVVCTQHG